MADDVEQRLVVPDVVFMRRDVEIANQNRVCLREQIAERVQSMEFVEECELVREFRVDGGVGLVAARWNIKVVKLDRSVVELESGADVAGVALVAEVAADSVSFSGRREAMATP